MQVVRLLNPHVYGAANATNFLGDGIRHLLVGRLISPNNLNVVGSGKSEVNGFGYDVGRKEVEGYARKIAVKTKTQIAHIVSCRLMSG